MTPRLFRPDEPAVGQLCVRDIVSLYLRHSASEGTHCEEARTDRDRVLSDFVAVYGDLRIEDCRSFQLTDWIESHPRWKSLGTKRAKAAMVRAVFRWAHDQERIDRHPFRTVRYAESERRPNMPDKTLGELERLADKPFEKVLRFLRLTGCRLGELCEAVYEDIDFDRGLWVIHRHKSRRYTNKPKVVALVAEAAAMLLPPKPGHLFLNTRGLPWNRRSLYSHFTDLKAKHGITTRATLHGIRHQAATAAIAAGAPVKLVSEQLGHATSAITEKFYWHKSDEHIDAIRQAFDRGIQK